MLSDLTLTKLAKLGDTSSDWVLDHGPKILVILFVAFVISTIITNSTKKIISKTIGRQQRGKESDGKQRQETLAHVFEGTINVVTWGVVMLMIFDNIGVNIGPILATAGVLGVAVGFGSQYLIRDLISGFFIIIENHYRVGDMICVGPNCGFVSAINLRLTTLCDQDGTVFHIPNGEIRISLNQSKLHSKVNFSMGVAPEAKLEKVITIINKIGEELTHEDEWKSFITSAPHFARVDNFTDTAMILRVQGTTRPMKQMEVTAELRKRIKLALDKADIQTKTG